MRVLVPPKSVRILSSAAVRLEIALLGRQVERRQAWASELHTSQPLPNGVALSRLKRAVCKVLKIRCFRSTVRTADCRSADMGSIPVSIAHDRERCKPTPQLARCGRERETRERVKDLTRMPFYDSEAGAIASATNRDAVGSDSALFYLVGDEQTSFREGHDLL